MSASTTKDQYFAGCVFTRTQNNAVKSANYYVEKRPGLSNASQVQASSAGTAIFMSPSTGQFIMAFGDTNSTIYRGSTSAGTITGLCYFINETKIDSTTYYLLTSSDGTGWYLADDATTDTSFTGDTHTSTTIDNIAGAGGIYIGQAISGTGIQAGTRVLTRTPDTTTPTSITITLATTATNAGVTITKTPVAKIIDSDFPTAVGGFAVMDGYIFVMTSTGRVYNSDLNSIISWSPSNYITANISTDAGMGCIKYNNHILAFGNESLEFFYNAGNSSGSILSSRKELFSQKGMYAGGGSYQAVTQINNNVYWIGNDMCLYTLDGFAPKVLSEMGMKLGTVNVPPFQLSSFRIGVDTIINISASTSTTDKWFSVATGNWVEPVWSVAGVIASLYPSPVGNYIGAAVAGGNLGNFYLIDTAVYQDNAVAYTLTIQTEPKVLNKGDPFIVKRTRLIADNQASGTTNLDMSADDYTNWIDIGDFDMTGTQKEVWGGLFCESSCAFKLEHSANTAWRGQAIVVDWEPANV